MHVTVYRDSGPPGVPEGQTLLQPACALLMWCLERNIQLTDQYLPGRENVWLGMGRVK